MQAYEPEWTKSIPSNTVCSYFYVLFFIVAVGAGLVVVADLAYIVGSGFRRGYMLLLRSLLMLAIPVLNALFLYVLCARSLLERR